MRLSKTGIAFLVVYLGFAWWWYQSYLYCEAQPVGNAGFLGPLLTCDLNLSLGTLPMSLLVGATQYFMRITVTEQSSYRMLWLSFALCCIFYYTLGALLPRAWRWLRANA